MTRRSTRVAGGMAMVALPLLLLAAAIVHPPHRTWDTAIAVAASHRERWYVGHVLVLLAMALLVLAVVELGRTLRAPRGRLELAGAGLTLVGAIGVGALAGVELVVWEMSHASLDQVEMGALGERMASSMALVVPLFAMLAGLALGICMLALALERSGTGPRWRALIGGVALSVAIVALPLPAVAIPAAVCALGGLGSIGFALLTSGLPAPEPARPAGTS